VAYENQVSINVTGVQAAMKTLRDVDKKLYWQMLREMKDAAKPIAAAIEGNFPGEAPLSGMHNKGRFQWSKRKKPQIRYGGKTRRDGTKPLIRIVVTDAPSSLFDMAATSHDSRDFAGHLSDRFGSASRAVWRTSRATQAEAVRAVNEAADKVMKATSRSLSYQIGRHL
jgi:hypothetical protein